MRQPGISIHALQAIAPVDSFTRGVKPGSKAIKFFPFLIDLAQLISKYALGPRSVMPLTPLTGCFFVLHPPLRGAAQVTHDPIPTCYAPEGSLSPVS